MSNTSILTTAVGWVVVAGATTAYWYYNSNKSKNKTKPQPPAKQAHKAPEDRKEPKAKKSKKDAGVSSGDPDTKSSTDKSQKKKKAQSPPKPEPKQESAKPSVVHESDNDDEADNRKFALQFAQTQAGTKFSGKSTSTNRQKSVKQSRAQEKQPKDSGNLTAGSATGGDADDDQSFTDSPEVGPTSIATPVSNNVSDMLEAPAPGPSVLRVTEPANPKPAKKEKAKPAPAPVETKKQRQNRAKVEAAKVAREIEEKERKIKEQNQRRIAREAEGRAPKDGRQFMASQQPSTSAWAASSANDGSDSSAKKVSTGKFDLLDTVEDSSSKPTATAQPETFSESELAGSNWQNYGDDDERVKSVIEESREWSQVQNKKRKTKKEKKENNSGEGAGTASSTDEKEYTIPPVTARSEPGQKWNAELTYVKGDEVHEVQKELQDSEWVVS